MCIGCRYCRSLKITNFLVAFCIIVAMGSIVCGFLSLVQEAWLRFEVNGSPLSDDTYLPAYTRSQGMLFECPDDPNAKIIQSAPSILKSNVKPSCFWIDFGYQNSNETNYWYLTRLRCAHVGLHCTGILLVIIALIMQLTFFVLQCRSKAQALKSKLDHPRHLHYAAAAFYFCAIILFVCSMTVFHVKITAEKWLKSLKLRFIYTNWSTNLKASTAQSYGPYYAVAWIACLGAVICFIILMCTSLCCYKPRHVKTKRSHMLPEVSNMTTTFINQPVNGHVTTSPQPLVVDVAPQSHTPVNNSTPGSISFLPPSAQPTNRYPMGGGAPEYDDKERVLIPIYFKKSDTDVDRLPPTSKPDAFYAILPSGDRAYPPTSGSNVHSPAEYNTLPPYTSGSDRPSSGGIFVGRPTSRY